MTEESVVLEHLRSLVLLLLFRFFFFFFFSSRRRHTRLTCDWSSDVCSSDLAPRRGAPARREMPPRSAAGVPIPRSEERRVGKSVDLGGRRIIKKKKKKKRERRKERR